MPLKHGTISCYTNDECRCDICRAAWSKYIRTRRAKRRKFIRDHPRSGKIPHGTSDGYTNWQCRCRKCKAAHAEEARERRDTNQ